MEGTTKKPSRYCVGIDLGTTNCVMSYVDKDDKNPFPTTVQIPQIVAPGEVMSLPSLPSFIYLPEENEINTALLKLPWDEEAPSCCIGSYAHDLSARKPSQVVSSAKSWLCCDKIDRHSECLPLRGEGEKTLQLSPVQSTMLILNHLKSAWNYLMASADSDYELEKQELIITVPASFDAVARDLTVEAAQMLGLEFTLLEEPQAAFYAWLSDHRDDWRENVTDGDVVLVCDLGGGTTDFSLIAVTDDNGDMELQRLAVGEHTLLGGDNMDLALAYTLSRRLKEKQGITLSQRQFMALTHACRKAKENFGSGSTEDQELPILGTGSSLIGESIHVTVTHKDMTDAILEGFFPKCKITDMPIVSRRSGLRSFSLDYAEDPAFTKHLAKFLNQHSFKDADGNVILPTAVLFNGGVTKPSLFKKRILETLSDWQNDSSTSMTVLEQKHADESVAAGAAWLGYVKQNGGIRIKAGTARSYYIGIEPSMPAIPGMEAPLEALCVVNQGLEEGSTIDIATEDLALIVGEQTEFRFFTSTTRQDDNVSDRFDITEDCGLTEIPSLQVTLSAEELGGNVMMVPVTLRVELTDIGTLQIWCHSAKINKSWRLEFDIRGE